MEALLLVGLVAVLAGEVLLYRVLRPPRVAPPVVPVTVPEPVPTAPPVSSPTWPAPIAWPPPQIPATRVYTDTFVVLHGEELLYRGENGAQARDAYTNTQPTLGAVAFWHSGVLRGRKG